MKKVFLAIPTHRYIEPETMSCINTKIRRFSNFYTISEMKIRRGSPNIYYQRYNLAMDFLKTDADYYLYFDSDQVVVEPDNFVEMLIKDDKDIISPIIVRRFFPHTPTCMTYYRHANKELFDDFRNQPYLSDRPIKVYYSGGGIVLIKRKVIAAVDKPFQAVFDRDRDMLSTDYSFYHKAKAIGFECWVEPRIVTGHIGHFVFTLDDYYSLLDSGQLNTGVKISKKFPPTTG
ncbi:hypothetical protein ES702_05970 [subsurface metagenome]